MYDVQIYNNEISILIAILNYIVLHVNYLLTVSALYMRHRDTFP